MYEQKSGPKQVSVSAWYTMSAIKHTWEGSNRGGSLIAKTKQTGQDTCSFYQTMLIMT